MRKITTLAWETGLYGLGSIVPRALNFFLVILHTRIFLPEIYGRYVSLYAWVAFINIVYLFGMETAYFRFATKEGADEQRTFRMAQTFVVFISLALSLIIVLCSKPIAEQFHIAGHGDFIIWLAILMFVDAAVSIPFARLRLLKKGRQFAIAKLINVAIIIGLNIYFLQYAFDPSVGIGYPILANLLANLFYLIFFSTTLIRWRPLWDSATIGSMFRYAYPVMLMGLAGMTNEMFSRVTLEWWLPENFYPGKEGSYALGVFGACFRFSVIVNVCVQAFRFAAEPFFFSQAADKNSPELFARVNHYFIIACSFIVLGVVVNLDILKFIIDEEYWVGLGVVPFLLFGYLFLGIYYNLSVWFKLTDRTHYGTFITLFGVTITIALNYLLIPHYGYLGSSWATLACYFSMTVTSYWLGQKYYPIPYNVVNGIMYLFLALVLILVAEYIPIENQVAATAFHFGLLFTFAGYAFLRERKSWNEAKQNG